MEDETKVEEVETIEPVTPQETSESEDSSEDEIDYKAELEKERKRRERAEYALKERNMADKRQKESPTWDDEDIDSRIEAKLEARMSQMRASQVGDVIDETLDSLGSTPEEKELIKYHYENSVIQTGVSRNAVLEDMRKAKLLANAAKYERTNAELAETVIAKKSMGKGGGTNVDKPSHKPDLSKSFTEQEWRFMQDRGFTEQMIKSAADLKKSNQF